MRSGHGGDQSTISPELARACRDRSDSWCLVFDAETRRLLVRHEWQTSRHNGFDELEVAEFLKQTGGAQAALIDSLFPVPADA